jgi:DnaJ like chaperone protein
MFLEIQMAVACSDGEMHSAEEALLRKIANWLGFSSQQCEWMLQRAMASIRFAHQQHQYQGQAGGHYAGPSSATQLTDAYRILGVEKSATDAEVKRAYRKLMSQHHPDKLVSKGLPEEMIKIAKEKTQEIKGAYELIMKTRKELEISCAKRREVIRDGSAAASVWQMVAPETSSYLAILDGKYL